MKNIKPQKWSLNEILAEIDRLALNDKRVIPDEIKQMVCYARSKNISWQKITELASKMGFNASKSYLREKYEKEKWADEISKKRNSKKL